MYKCDIKIMGVETRQLFIVENLLKLDLTFDDVSIDIERRGPVWNNRNAFNMAYSKGVTHRCVIQDDVELCKDFREFINKLVNIYPDAIWSFFCGNGIKDRLRSTPPNTIVRTGGTIWGQAVVMPKKYLEEFTSFSETYEKLYYLKNHKQFKYDDQIIQKFARVRDIEVYTFVPYIVRHTHTTKALSEMGHENANSEGWYDLSSPMHRTIDTTSYINKRGISYGMVNDKVAIEFNNKKYIV